MLVTMKKTLLENKVATCAGTPAVTVKEAVLAFVVAVPITALVVFDVGALFWTILITLIVLGLFALGVWKAVELIDMSDWLN